MNIYEKLQKAKVELSKASLKKTGLNKFNNAKYFELSDFMPKVNEIFDSLGLCGVISCTDSIATLTIYNNESVEYEPTAISVCLPMSTAELGGCHPVQNLGAVTTYTRRYLWMLALDIVEEDTLDATDYSKKGNTKQQYQQRTTQKSADVPHITVSKELKCSECGLPITEAENGFSIKKYGRALCRGCQKTQPQQRSKAQDDSIPPPTQAPPDDEFEYIPDEQLPF